MTPADRWLVGYEKCRVCGATGVAVVEEGADLDALECHACGHMTAEMDKEHQP